ncbi:GntR family transcriptional regulator [Sphingobacterium psychroaquaticum]|uniref:GntR family transcriptional regulator n=1 Tax=Sphingobacterium psychroaquaticum TaxID=561061 RepID=UPI00106C6EFC|nr:GntR family transcriptional regulator [Sphingobacterium psychroaquaticum]QBQ40092.1 GntR family transcriptional regulator [Sphingobacterium psychroaquaticum]
MLFTSDKAIYLQIKELVMEKILLEEWLPDTKLPSVRDFGAEIEVNPNTVMRAYDILQQDQIIYNRRGVGFFVSPEARALAQQEKKKEFIETELPTFFKTMHLLKMEINEIINLYNDYKS